MRCLRLEHCLHAGACTDCAGVLRVVTVPAGGVPFDEGGVSDGAEGHHGPCVQHHDCGKGVAVVGCDHAGRLGSVWSRVLHRYAPLSWVPLLQSIVSVCKSAWPMLTCRVRRALVCVRVPARAIAEAWPQINLFKHHATREKDFMVNKPIFQGGVFGFIAHWYVARVRSAWSRKPQLHVTAGGSGGRCWDCFWW